MAVYVDEIRNYGVMKGRNGPKWCHMTADTPLELHTFAAALGLSRDWYQDKPHHHHYDLTESKRAEAVSMGATELSPREYVTRNRQITASGAYTPKPKHVAPTNADEFNALYMKNQYITGYGAQVVTHFPCYGCAAPDFLHASILTTQEDLGKGGTCQECGRSFQTIYHPTPAGATQFEVVQTGGPDMPDWQIKLRRV